MMKSAIISLIVFGSLLSGCISKNDRHVEKVAPDSVRSKALNETPVMRGIFFAGQIGKKSGLYKYELSTKIYSECWHNDEEEVVELSYSPDKKSAFLLTAHQSGKRGVFPFINKVKLYSISVDSGAVKFIDNIGTGLQVFSVWENNNSFRVVLNIIDVTVAKEVDQLIKTFNSSGEKISDEEKTYNLAKDGFPQFIGIKKDLLSPNKRFSISSFDSAQTQIYLMDHSKNDAQIMIARLNQKLNYVDWSNDGNFLFFSTIDISPGNETLYDKSPATSKLFIFSLRNTNLIKTFEGAGIKNFMFDGDILLFDDGFGDKSRIFIYNFRTDQMIDSIKISGGCGLKKIPMIPDYSA